jgi:Zinc finger, C3HC4 type (RING finger)
MDDLGAKITCCSECGSSAGPFSHRQIKKGIAARCTPCIGLLFPLQEEQDRYKEDQATALEKSHDKHDDDDEKIEENIAKKRRKIINMRDDDSNEAIGAPLATTQQSNARILQDDHTSQKENKRRHVNLDDVDDSGATVSINAIKRKIMRRDLETNDEDDDDDDETKMSLLQELSCVICHELLYDPISLPNCGHSFCAKCWAWWEAKSRIGVVSCPTCRTDAVIATKNHGDTTTEDVVWKPTRALQVAIAALFPNETADRKLAVAAGENEGRHRLGNAVILPIQEHDWRMVVSADGGGGGRRLKVRRSIVLDETDQRMVYGLAIQGDVSWENGSSTVRIAICRLHMEQDEAEEGFPVHIPNDTDDECLIVPDDDTMIAVFDAQGPVSRHSISSGFVELRDMHPTVPAKCYSIRHESTGCELQIQAFASTGLGGGGGLSEQNHRVGAVARAAGSRSLVDEGHCSTDDEEEAQAAALEAEEEEDDDGFLVDESVCQICNDGGELLVCDGGGRGGCARSFHVTCIGRREVPAGDWICQDCAAENAITTGKEGHEYPEDSDDDDRGGVEVFAEFSGEDDDDEEEEEDDIDVRVARHNPSAAVSRQRRVILVDSDDESD